MDAPEDVNKDTDLNHEKEGDGPEGCQKTTRREESEGPTTEEQQETEGRMEQLKRELDEKKEQIQNYREKLQHLQADFENYKKRQKEDRSEQVQAAEGETILDFLPIYDNLVRAFRSFDRNDDTDSFIDGIEKIYAQFTELLEKKRIEPLNAEGDQFDPNKHEALMKVESENHDHKEVIEEFERGYTYKGQVLKPSKVKVNILTNQKANEEEEGDQRKKATQADG
ncbi:MAG: nucleotide exchange factor GrpE [Candidatus Acetothermia bacterium]